jgi:hypothetical protein
MKSKSNAKEHFEREKARRATKAGPNTELMAAARREYEALLEAQAKKGKGGRPKKKAAAKPKVEDDEIDDADDVGLEDEADADES